MSGLLPSQHLARSYLLEAGSRHFHDADPAYVAALRGLISKAGPTLVCDHCKWSAKASDVAEFAALHYTTVKDLVDAQQKPYKTETILPGGQIFWLHNKNHDHDDFDQANICLVCEPCHHAFHIAVAGLDPTGEVDLIPYYSQADIINLWRILAITAMAKTPRGSSASNYLVALQSFGGEAIGMASRNGSKHQHGSPKGLRHWIANGRPELVERVNVVLPDLRFIPKDNTFSFYLVFCATYQKAELGELAPALPKMEPQSTPLATA